MNLSIYEAARSAVFPANGIVNPRLYFVYFPCLEIDAHIERSSLAKKTNTQHTGDKGLFQQYKKVTYMFNRKIVDCNRSSKRKLLQLLLHLLLCECLPPLSSFLHSSSSSSFYSSFYLCNLYLLRKSII